MAKSKTTNFFRFQPRDSQPGFSPLVGDVVPGGIYEVRDELVDRFVDHPDWEPASESDFNKQEDPSV